MTEPTRSYRSPLREAQASQTRELILDTFAELVGTGRVEGWSVREIATAAGVSERTVYRYFPDRAALLDGLSDWLTDRMGTAHMEASLENADDLARVIPEVFRRFDAEAELTRAAVLLSPDPGRPTDEARRRTERVGGFVARSFPDLPDADLRRLHALVRSLSGSSTWLRMRDEFGLSGDESGTIVGWALTVLFEELRAGGSIVSPE
jgi:AcrR family transcriptional regulator